MMALKHRVVQRFNAEAKSAENSFSLARGAIQEWLATRKDVAGLPVDLGLTFVDLGGGHRASFQRLDGDGFQAARWRVIAGSAPHTYLSTITVFVSNDGNDNWLWYDVESGRDDSRFAPPQLTARLTRALGSSPRDRISGFTEGLRKVGAEDIGQFLDEVLEAEDRQVPALISGGVNWSLAAEEHVEQAFAPLYGLATFWKLDSEAFDEFNGMVKPGYRVFPGSVHSYQYGLDTEDDFDARRHWWFSAAEVTQSTPRDLSSRLHLEAMRSGVQVPLPIELRTLNEQFERSASRKTLEFFDTLLLSSAPEDEDTSPEKLPDEVVHEPLAPPSVRTAKPSADPNVELVHLVEAAASEFGASTSRSLNLIEKLTNVFATVRVRLKTLQDRLPQAHALDEVRNQLESLVDEKTALESDNDELNALLALHDEEARDSGEVLREQRELAGRERRRADFLAQQLSNLSAKNQSAVVWDVPEAHGKDDLSKIQVPETVADLLTQIDRLPHVSFTGDKKIVQSITDAKLRDLILRDAWIIACELERYSRQFDDSEAGVRGLSRFVQEKSTDITPSQFANDESSNVKNTKKYSQPRVLPVPVDAVKEGSIFMGAHFRLTHDNGKAMRMHIHDSVAVNGQVYIGYIGPHLPSRMTT